MSICSGFFLEVSGSILDKVKLDTGGHFAPLLDTFTSQTTFWTPFEHLLNSFWKPKHLLNTFWTPFEHLLKGHKKIRKVDDLLNTFWKVIKKFKRWWPFENLLKGHKKIQKVDDILNTFWKVIKIFKRLMTFYPPFEWS